jgi:hypothetical protein
MATAWRTVGCLEVMETIFTEPVEVRWVNGVKELELELEVRLVEVVFRRRYWKLRRKGRDGVICLYSRGRACW